MSRLFITIALLLCTSKVIAQAPYGQVSYATEIAIHGGTTRMLSFDTLGWFYYREIWHRPCMEGISKRSIGQWQQVDNAILLRVSNAFVGDRLVEEVNSKENAVADQLTVTLVYDTGEPVARRQVRFDYRDKDDFVVWYTDTEGKISLPKDTFKSFDLLGFHWQTNNGRVHAIEMGGGEIEVVINKAFVYNQGTNQAHLPETVVLHIQEDCTLKFEGFLEGVTLGQLGTFNGRNWSLTQDGRCIEDQQLPHKVP